MCGFAGTRVPSACPCAEREQLDARPDPGLGEHRRDMVLDRPLGAMQPLRDLLVTPTIALSVCCVSRPRTSPRAGADNADTPPTAGRRTSSSGSTCCEMPSPSRCCDRTRSSRSLQPHTEMSRCRRLTGLHAVDLRFFALRVLLDDALQSFLFRDSAPVALLDFRFDGLFRAWLLLRLSLHSVHLVNDPFGTATNHATEQSACALAPFVL